MPVISEEQVQDTKVPAEEARRDPSPPVRGRRKAFLIFFFVLLLVGAAAFLYWLHARQFESTDNAQIDAHLNPVSARIDGTISKVYVEDNQGVQAGDALVDLDGRD